MDWDPARADAFRGARGFGWIWLPAPDVMVTRLVGQAERSAVSFYTERAGRLLDAGVRLHVFHDWSKVVGYDPDARDALREWAASRDTQFGDVHYFVQSRVVAMALGVAALTLGRRLFTHLRAEPFQAALDQRLGAA